MTPDNGEKFVVERSNATLTNIKGFTAAAADLTITMNRDPAKITDFERNTKLCWMFYLG